MNNQIENKKNNTNLNDWQEEVENNLKFLDQKKIPPFLQNTKMNSPKKLSQLTCLLILYGCKMAEVEEFKYGTMISNAKKINMLVNFDAKKIRVKMSNLKRYLNGTCERDELSKNLVHICDIYSRHSYIKLGKIVGIYIKELSESSLIGKI